MQMHRLVLLLAMAACSGSPSAAAPSGAYVLVVDHVWKRSSTPEQPRDIPDAAYFATPPTQRWSVTFAGENVTLVPVAGGDTVRGIRTEHKGAESTYRLDEGLFAGGELTVRGTVCTVTTLGSGVPIIASERGTLVRR